MWCIFEIKLLALSWSHRKKIRLSQFLKKLFTFLEYEMGAMGNSALNSHRWSKNHMWLLNHWVSITALGHFFKSQMYEWTTIIKCRACTGRPKISVQILPQEMQQTIFEKVWSSCNNTIRFSEDTGEIICAVYSLRQGLKLLCKSHGASHPPNFAPNPSLYPSQIIFQLIFLPLPFCGSLTYLFLSPFCIKLPPTFIPLPFSDNFPLFPPTLLY